jgi:hypothetical protein
MIDERPYGQFERQLFLGDNLDPAGCRRTCTTVCCD